MKRVIVLEDMEHRVQWLQQVLRRSKAKIVWKKDVESFIKASKKPHDMAIFDHDLGILPTGGYTTPLPLNGADAARLYDPEVKVPVLIWSVNPEGGKRIEQILLEKGIPAGLVPFFDENLYNLARMLRELFETD